MEALESIRLDRFPYDNIRKFSDIIYYDGPLLSHFKSETGEDYLFYWIDNNEEYNRWLVLNVDNDHLFEYLNGHRSLLSIINQNYNLTAVTVDIDSEINYHNSQFIQTKKLPSEFLPTEESLYTLGLPKAYVETYALAIEENNYIETLRERSVFFKLNSLEVGFGNTIATDDATTFLSKLTKSFRSYVDARFKVLFGNAFKDFKSLQDAVNNLKEQLTPRIVGLQYASFGIDLATDNLSRVNMNKEVAVWQKNVLGQYKNDVIEFDFTLGGELPESLRGLTDEQLSEILQPIIQLSKSPNFTVEVGDERRGEIKRLKRVSKRVEDAFFSKTPVAGLLENREKEFTNLVIEVPKGTDVSRLSGKQLKNATVSMERDNKTIQKLHKIINKDGEETVFSRPIEYTLSLAGAFYEVSLKLLDLTFISTTKVEALEDLNNRIIKLYDRLILNYTEKLTPKDERFRQVLLDHLEDPQAEESL